MKALYEHSANFWKDGLTCPYCKKNAKWCENKEKYGRNFGKSYMCYWCKDCDSYVGCHENTRRPLGSMANKELRQLRMKCHDLIDKFWKEGNMNRKEMYRMLNEKFGRTVHIGWSNEEECREIIKEFTPPLS